MARTHALRAINALYQKHRDEDGMNQEALAERVGRPQSYVSRVLTGTKRLDVDDIERFARAYGITISQLLDLGAKLPATGGSAEEITTKIS